MNKRSNSRGFSLIEVMVALLVLALGILGISKLQGTLIRNSSDANQRAIAVSIAQEKIDDLKSFSKINTSDTWAVSGQSSNLIANDLAFIHIDDNEGGAPLGTEGLLANQTISRGNAVFNLTWDVEDYEFDTGAMTAASSASSTIDFKEVTIDVSWIDEVSSQQSISLSTIIDSRNPALISLSGKSKQGGEPPVAEYTPEEAPDVINVEVDTGNNKFRQTSKPLPDAISQGQNANTVVSFDVVTYSSYNGPISDLDFVADTLEEYVTVDCQCQFSTSNSVSRTAAHVQWDPETNTRLDYPGDLISKQTATPTGNVNAVEELCTTCCRDHHDVNDASKPVYVPGTTGGNHDHYQADGITTASQASGETYVESCRMKRIDGIYRVFQDWQLYDMTAMLRSDLADGQALQTSYSTYVGNFILNQVDPNPDVIATKPDDETDISGSKASEGAQHQLQSRGIYIDQVYEPETANFSSAYLNYIDDSGNTDRLDKIPFSEVNLTLLANWSSGDTDHVTVTDEDVATIPDPDTDYYGEYSRGFIELKLDSAGEEIPVTATISDNNNGLTQIIDPSNVGVSDPIQVVVGPPGDEIILSGSYDFSYPDGFDPSKVNVSISMTGDDNNCSLLAGNTFTCGMTSPWSGDIIIETTLKGNPKCSGTTTYSPDAPVTESDGTLYLTGTCT